MNHHTPKLCATCCMELHVTKICAIYVRFVWASFIRFPLPPLLLGWFSIMRGYTHPRPVLPRRNRWSGTPYTIRNSMQFRGGLVVDWLLAVVGVNQHYQCGNNSTSIYSLPVLHFNIQPEYQHTVHIQPASIST
jgi:hypothetical protein